MSDERAFLLRLFGLLSAAEIPAMLTGSVASGIHGDTRATNDVDVVIDPTAESLAMLLNSLPSTEYYVNAATAREALAQRQMFNVIEFQTGMKADLIVRKSRPFSIAEFERRVVLHGLPIPIAVATAEDVILAKLEWAELGQSERQYSDALAVARVQAEQLDAAYLRRWAPELGVASLLERLFAEAGITGA